MNSNRSLRNLAALLPLCLALLSGGCAEQAPLNSSFSGKQLIVTMTYNAPVDSSQYYFFVINAENLFNAKGPVAVFGPPSANGFATVSGQEPDGTTAQGFTDYVEFNRTQPQATGYYGLYHVLGKIGDPTNPPQFVGPQGPAYWVAPNQDSSQLSSATLQFTIDLAQLITDSSGHPLSLTDPQTAIKMAQQLRWIQINMISTNTISTSPTSTFTKETDSLGDTTQPNQRISWIQLDLTQNTTYSNTNNPDNLIEPSGDVYPDNNDSPIDLVSWNIQVVQR